MMWRWPSLPRWQKKKKYCSDVPLMVKASSVEGLGAAYTYTGMHGSTCANTQTQGQTHTHTLCPQSSGVKTTCEGRNVFNVDNEYRWKEKEYPRQVKDEAVVHFVIWHDKTLLSGQSQILVVFIKHNDSPYLPLRAFEHWYVTSSSLEGACTETGAGLKPCIVVEQDS